MLDKFIFENHLGLRFEGLPNGVYLNYSELRDYSWNYDTINNRISRFYMGTKKRKLPLVVKCNSDEEAVAVMNRLHELAEADIAARIPGKVFVGDYYTTGYITASNKSDYLINKHTCNIDLTLTSDDPAWYREKTYSFQNSGDNEPIAPNIPKNAEGTSIVINGCDKGVVFNGLTIYGKTIQNGTPTPDNPVELVSTGASGAIKVVATDGTETKVKTLTVSTPNGLNGVPVSTGGNYTDENGQQWICDEIDFARGVYVKRTDKMDMGSLNWGVKADGIFYSWDLRSIVSNGILCDKYVVGTHAEVYEKPTKDMAICIRGELGSKFIGLANSDYASSDHVTAKQQLSKSLIGTTLLYSLAEPIETPLSAEELAAYKALRTNNPTTVFNDGDAYMAISYYPNTDSFSFGGGTDLPYDYPFDYATSLKGRKIVCDSVGGNSFRIRVYGKVDKPTIVISGHAYSVNGLVNLGENLLIDSATKTITLTTVLGNKVNWFDKRGRDSYIFEPIPAGQNVVSWSGTFGFELTVIEKRSEPRWT